jgi:tetratricopeptide (TPR) repeat protein
MKRTLFSLLVLASGCATQQNKKEVRSGPVPNAGIMKQDVGGVKDDAAVRAFVQEAEYIKAASQKGKLDWAEVDDRMSDIVRKHPSYALAWYNKGVALEKLGKSKEAEEAYRRASALNPALHEAQENLAALAAKRGDAGEAMSLLRELVARDPGAATARFALAQYALSQGDVEEAIALCQDGLSHAPKNIAGYCVLAQAAVKQKDHLRARLLAAQGLKIDKSAGCLHFVLGQVAMAEGSTGVALKAFETAVQQNPELVEARFRIAQISLGFKDFKKAIDNYVAITQVEPKNAAAFVNLGIALKGSGRYQEAEKAYLQAVEVASGPAAAPAHYNLGVLYLRDLKKPDQAQEHLKRVLQLGDGDEDGVFKMLEEIEQMRLMAEEEKRLEAEAKAQEEMERRMAEEEAKQKKLDEEINKKLEAEEQKRAADEPSAPAAKGDTPPIEAEKSEPKPKAKPKARKKRAAPRKAKEEAEPADPSVPSADEFE